MCAVGAAGRVTLPPACPKAKPPPSTEGGKRCAGSKEVRKRYWKREGQDPPLRGMRRWLEDEDRPGDRSLRMRRGDGGRQVAAPTDAVGVVKTAALRGAGDRGAARRFNQVGGRSMIAPTGAEGNGGWPMGSDPTAASGGRREGERVAAVGERRRCVSTKDIRRAPQQGVPTREVIDLIRRCAPPSPEGKVLVVGDRCGCGGRMGKGGSRPSPTSKWKTENGE